MQLLYDSSPLIIKIFSVLFVAFCGAVMGKIISSYQRWIYLKNMRAYVCIWFEQFELTVADCINSLKTNNAVFENLMNLDNYEPTLEMGEFMFEFDIERILNINQSDSYNIFSNLTAGVNRNVIHSAYHQMLVDLKIITIFEKNFVTNMMEFKKLNDVKPQIDIIYNKLCIEIVECYKLRDELKDDSKIVLLVSDLYKMKNDLQKEIQKGNKTKLKLYEEFSRNCFNYVYRNYSTLHVFPNSKTILETSSLLNIELKKVQTIFGMTVSAHNGLIHCLEKYPPAIMENYRICLTKKLKPFHKIMFNL